MLCVISLLSTVWANGNCANFDLCGGDQYLLPNASFISCAQDICSDEDISTCCGDKKSSKASWDFLMIYLIVLTVTSILCFLAYRLRSYSNEKGEHEEHNKDEGGNNMTLGPTPGPKSDVVAPLEIEEEDAETVPGRVYLL